MSNNLQRKKKKKIFQGQLENTEEFSFTLNGSQQKCAKNKYLNMLYLNACL